MFKFLELISGGVNLIQLRIGIDFTGLRVSADTIFKGDRLSNIRDDKTGVRLNIQFSRTMDLECLVF